MMTKDMLFKKINEDFNQYINNYEKKDYKNII